MPRQRLIAAAGLIGALWLGGCTDGYGYSGVSLGYGGGYDGAYGYDGGYGYAPSYYGWYGDYYYPGTGIYVYDRYRRPYRWSADQRRYWRGRPGWRDDRGPGHWRDFDRAGDGRPGWTPGQARPDRGGWRRQAEAGRPQARPNAARDMPPRPGFVPGQRPPEAGGVAPRRGFGQDGRGARRGQERE